MKPVELDVRSVRRRNARIWIRERREGRRLSNAVADAIHPEALYEEASWRPWDTIRERLREP